jgi:hypothetical protein
MNRSLTIESIQFTFILVFILVFFSSHFTSFRSLSHHDILSLPLVRRLLVGRRTSLLEPMMTLTDVRVDKTKSSDLINWTIRFAQF